MCLIVCSFDPPTEHSFIMLANRDEFYDRSTRQMSWWKDDLKILAGKDLEAGGTWLAISKDGRFGALTNYRENPLQGKKLISRGSLITSYLSQRKLNAQSFFSTINGDLFSGFSLILGDLSGIHYFSNRNVHRDTFFKGTHVLANHYIDSITSKAGKVKKDFLTYKHKIHNINGYFRFMQNDKIEIDKPYQERLIQENKEIPHRFISSEIFGTRCITVLAIKKDGQYEISEKRFAKRGKLSGESSYSFYPS